MTAIVAIDPELMEFETAGDGRPPELRLVLTDKDGQQHRLTLEGKALLDLVDIFRSIQADLPGALGGH
jgi:hypothetical protein